MKAKSTKWSEIRPNFAKLRKIEAKSTELKKKKPGFLLR